MKKAAKGSISRTTKASAPASSKAKKQLSKAVEGFYQRLRTTAPPKASISKHGGKLTNPFEQGVTFSSLCLFDIDKVAYQASYGNGWYDDRPGNGLKFGTFFHELIDRYDGQKTIPSVGQCYSDLEPRRQTLIKSVMSQQEADDIDTLIGFACGMFPTYLKYWNNPATSVFPGGLTDTHIDWTGREEKFRVQHARHGMTGKPPIWINGKRDGRFTFSKTNLKKAPGVKQVLLETKTSSRPPSKTELDACVHKYAQVNIYALAMLLDPKIEELPTHVLYNVIQRPQHQRRGGRATKANNMQKIAEPIQEFVERVSEDVASRPQDFFIRSFREIPEEQIREFVQYELNPILKDVVDHWESIQANPAEPHLRNVVVDGVTYQTVNPEHRPRFKGIFDPEAVGLHRSLFDPMTAHSRSGLSVRDCSFPELEDE